MFALEGSKTTFLKMRLSTILLLLPAVASAQDQFPLAQQVQGWIEKAKSFLPSAAPAPAASSAESPSSAVPPKKQQRTVAVTPVTLNNWESLLGPASPASPKEAREWLIYITGGNKTCYGNCDIADKAFNESLPLFAADTTSPSLGLLNCEKESVLCQIWSTGPIGVWHVERPLVAEAGQPKPSTPIHMVRLNATTVTAQGIYNVHAKKLWEKAVAYEGAWHPFDGWLAEYKLNVVLGYIIFGMSQIPSWVMMIGISFLSRTMMSRRMGQPGRQAGGAQQPAAQ